MEETAEQAGETAVPVVMADQPLTVRPCSVAAALDILGERWSLLAVREISYGVHTFARIAAYTGASRCASWRAPGSSSAACTASTRRAMSTT